MAFLRSVCLLSIFSQSSSVSITDAGDVAHRRLSTVHHKAQVGVHRQTSHVKVRPRDVDLTAGARRWTVHLKVGIAAGHFGAVYLPPNGSS